MAPGPIAIGLGAVRAGRAGELIVPAVVLRKTADGRRSADQVDGAASRCRLPVARAVGVGVHIDR